MNFSRYEGLDALRVVCSLGVVFLHVYAAAGSPAALDLLIKLRDFALPVMVLTSFFLLTKSLMRRQAGGSASFFGRRVERLWLPLMVWTFLYCATLTFVLPFVFGAEARPEFPSPVVFLTGYRHLWFLQFVFVASAIVYLLFAASANLRISPTKSAAGCFAASAIYWFLYYSSIRNYAIWEAFDSEFDISFGIFISQASYFVMYVPAAVGLALISDKIKEWYAFAALRRLSLVAVLIAAAAHVGTNEFIHTREIYGLAVFLFALQPWRNVSFEFVPALARYSYAVYILHFLPAQLLDIFFGWSYFEPNAANVIACTIIIYMVSLATAVLIRRLFNAEWLLPVAGSGSEKKPMTG